MFDYFDKCNKQITILLRINCTLIDIVEINKALIEFACNATEVFTLIRRPFLIP